MSRPVCLHSHALSAHVGGDYPTGRTCGSNGIETASPQYVSCSMSAHRLISTIVVQTNRMCLAKCSLRVKLNWHGGNSVQKKRWPFFFFDGRCESLVTLSLSDPSSSAPSSASPSPISTSSDDTVDLFELPRFNDASSFFVRSGPCADGGSSGSGRWPRTPPKLCRVGVSGAESSAGVSGPVRCWLEKRTFGVGVVGVLSPPCRERSGALSEVWTMSLEASAIARLAGLSGRRPESDTQRNAVCERRQRGTTPLAG